MAMVKIYRAWNQHDKKYEGTCKEICTKLGITRGQLLSAYYSSSAVNGYFIKYVRMEEQFAHERETRLERKNKNKAMSLDKITIEAYKRHMSYGQYMAMLEGSSDMDSRW